MSSSFSDELQFFLQLLVNGVAMGAIYALVALSFVLVYKAVGVVNFATGDIVAVGGYVGVSLVQLLKLPLVLAFVLGTVVMAVFGYLFQLVGYYPLRGKPFLTVAISTLAIGIVLSNGILVTWGPTPQAIPPFIPVQSLDLGGVHVVPQHIVIIVVTALTLLGQHLLFSRTTLGRRMMATAQDPEMARLLGVRTDRMVGLTFALSAVLAAVAGFLLGPVFYLTPDMGFNIALRGFAAAIIGSFGSVAGAIVGGLALGVVEIFVGGYVSSAYRDVIVFGIMLAVLYVRPEGLLGEAIGRKV
jgi:branched-chain amino acid transport system permease protein